MKRILAIDFGMRRIGLAISDPLQVISTPLNTLIIDDFDNGVRQLIELCNTYDLESIIIGYPIGTSGNKTDQTRIVDKVILALKSKFDIPIIPWDERYTSVQAKDILKQQGLKARDDKGRVDQLAARIMLQEFLDSKGTR